MEPEKPLPVWVIPVRSGIFWCPQNPCEKLNSRYFMCFGHKCDIFKVIGILLFTMSVEKYTADNSVLMEKWGAWGRGVGCVWGWVVGGESWHTHILTQILHKFTHRSHSLSLLPCVNLGNYKYWLNLNHEIFILKLWCISQKM